MSKLILAIEDDLAIAELYEEVLIDAGYRIRLMAAKPADVQIIAQIQPDLIISDWGIAQEDVNWKFMNAMAATPRTAAIPMVVCTAISLKINNLGSLLNERKIEVLPKPFDIVELVSVIEKTIAAGC